MQPHERLLTLLDDIPLIKEHRTVELKIVDQATFSFKIRMVLAEVEKYLKETGVL